MTDLERIQGSSGDIYSWTTATPRASGGSSEVHDAETVDGVRFALKVVNVRDDDTRQWNSRVMIDRYTHLVPETRNCVAGLQEDLFGSDDDGA